MEHLQKDQQAILQPVSMQGECLSKNDALPVEIEALAKSVYRMNFIFSKFNQLDDGAIEEWAKIINKACPEMTDEILRHLVNGMMMGQYDFNPNIGIRNIFLAYEKFADTPILIYDKKDHEENGYTCSSIRHGDLKTYVKLKQSDNSRYFIYRGSSADYLRAEQGEALKMKLVNMIWPGKPNPRQMIL